MRLGTRFATSAAALIAALPALAKDAAAEPELGALGISLGRSEDEAGYNGEANRTLGVWGRMRLSRRISGQIELARIQSPPPVDDSMVRSGTVLIVVDVRSSGRLVPVIFAGAGLDRVTYFSGDLAMKARHYEGGVGLEYRADGGLFVGVDVRHGGRSIDNDSIVLDGGSGGGEPPPAGVPRLGAPPPSDPPLGIPGIAEGEYLAWRLTVGARF